MLDLLKEIFYITKGISKDTEHLKIDGQKETMKSQLQGAGWFIRKDGKIILATGNKGENANKLEVFVSIINNYFY